MAKYVFVTGGVLSSLGKGITASSIGAIFKSQGYSVMIKKFDPYLNFNPGMMSPLQHGEVFVTEDGGEGDLDLGHYERFINANTNKNCDVTSGKVYYSVIEKERRGGFKGETVQVIPHITDKIKEYAMDSYKDYDIILIEIGGTVGDIEGQPYLEAIRQLRFDLGDSSVAYIHVTPLIYVKTAGELKTKPTQHSVQKLREIGITPDVLVCRTEHPISPELKNKLALFCNIRQEAVVSAIDASPLYHVILDLYKEGVAKIVLSKLDLENRPADLSSWENLIYKLNNPSDFVKIGVVGKYIDMKDAYISIDEALSHAGVANDVKVEIEWIDAEKLNNSNAKDYFREVHGILIPGGFGERGMSGKIAAAGYARKNDIPFFGLGSLGMQCAVIEALVAKGLENATTMEVSQDSNEHVFVYVDDKGSIICKQGRMKLGAHTTFLQEGSLAASIYGKSEITERHRHRLEFNTAYSEKLKEAGLSITGIGGNGFVDIVEYGDNKWFLACQFIPEYKSRPLDPHPLFKSFIKSALEYKKGFCL